MIQALLNSKTSIFLFCLIFTSSCINQLSEKSSNQSELTATKELPKDNGTKNNHPRVDSVLQFSVMVTSMFEDSKGNFWFGSHGDGLCRYDGKEFTYFTIGHGLPSGTVREFAPGLDWSKTRKINGGNQIGSIQEDKNGNIWISTNDNISKFNGQTFTRIHPNKESTLLTNRSSKEWKRELDYLWFGSSDKLGVFRFDGNKLEWLNFPPPYDSKVDGVSEVYKDNEGNIWFGTMGNGTFRYDGKSFTIINKKDEIGVCRSVFQDNTGRVWITNNRFGLNYLEGDTLRSFKKQYNLSSKNDPITKEFKTGYQSIEQDENGDLWFGTFGNGLWRYDSKKLTHYTNDDELSLALAKTIYKDKNGKLWFGIGEGTVYGFNGKSFDRFDGT